MKDQFDVVVIGADAPGLCAAASAALGGARVGVVSVAAVEASAPPMHSTIPGFVWRRLGLDRFEIETAPASARVTIVGADTVISTSKSVRESADEIGKGNNDDGVLWQEFFDKAREIAPRNEIGLFNANRDFGEIERAMAPCREIVSDFFGDGEVCAHFLAHALSPGGLGGWEAGSAGLLGQFVAVDAWPERSGRGKLIAALQSICAEAGVEMLNGDAAIEPCEKARWRQLRVGEAHVRSRRLFFSSPGAAAAYGVEGCDPAASQALGGATINVRLKLRADVAAPHGDASSVFQLIDNIDELVFARDAARAGRLADRLPVSFQFDDNGDIVARSAYCPRDFVDDDGDERGWTGQDRQAAAGRVVEKLKEHMPSLSTAIRKVETHLIGARSALPERNCRGVFIVSDYFDTIGAAVRLMDNALGAHV